MLRIKLPGGRAARRRSCARSARSRTTTAGATASSRRGSASSSTGSSSRAARGLRPTSTPPGSRPPAAAATPSATSPAARSPGSTHDELFDAHAGRRRGGRVLLRQPRLLEPAAQAQVHDLGLPRPLQRAGDQLRRARRRVHDGREGLRRAASAAGSPRCRASPATSASSSRRRRRSRCSRAITRRLVGGPPLPRLARQGAAQVHGRRHRPGGDARRASRSGSAARSRTSQLAAARAQLADHIGVHAQEQPGLVYVGVPVHLGLISGDQMIAVAELAERVGGDVRLTRQQNFVVTDVPGGARRRGRRASSRRSASRSTSTACAAARSRAPASRTATSRSPRRSRGSAADRGTSRTRFGDDVAGLRLHLDGCPHACAQHWVGDLGFQGTTARDEDGKRRQAYDIFLRGGLGPRRRDRPAALPPRADRGAGRDGRAAWSPAGSTDAATARPSARSATE